MANIELLDEVMEVIETYPEDWDQDAWVAQCGTAFCFAGHAAIRSHPMWFLEIKEDPFNHEYFYTQSMLDENREYAGPIKEVAQKALDIDWTFANQLFNADTSITALRRIVARIKSGVRY